MAVAVPVAVQCHTFFLFFVDRICKILVDFAIFFKKIKKRGLDLVKIVLMMTVCVNHDCCSNKTSSIMEFVVDGNFENFRS